MTRQTNRGNISIHKSKMPGWWQLQKANKSNTISERHKTYGPQMTIHYGGCTAHMLCTQIWKVIQAYLWVLEKGLHTYHHVNKISTQKSLWKPNWWL